MPWGQVGASNGGRSYRVFTPFSHAWREHGWPAPAEEPAGLRLTRLPGDDEADRLLDAALAPTTYRISRRRASGPPSSAGSSSATAHSTAYARRPRPARPRRDVPAVALPQAGRDPPAHAAGRPRGPAQCRGATGSSPSWRGASSTPTCCGTSPTRRGTTCGPRWPDGVRRVRGRLVEAWREGRTGYPVVDAGMRQLLAEGWMHNRVRMVAASFLTKDLHVWWPVGARHFLDHLVDGDIASNNHGWQWVAGTGTDAAPYFRVFNPVTQGQQFDPDGDYVRRWVPELRAPAGPRGPRAVEGTPTATPTATPSASSTTPRSGARRWRRYEAPGADGPGHGVVSRVRVRPRVGAARLRAAPLSRSRCRARHTESDAVFRRRRVVVAGHAPRGRGGARRWRCASSRATGSSTPRTLALAAVWARRRPAVRTAPPGRAHTRAGADPARPVVQSLALGVLLLAVFLVGARRGRARPRAARARRSSCSTTPARLARRGRSPSPSVNGVVEELYFRGALFAALPASHAVAITTVALRPDHGRRRHTAARPRRRCPRARHGPAAAGHRRHPRTGHHAPDLVAGMLLLLPTLTLAGS